MKLHSRISALRFSAPTILRVVEDPARLRALRNQEVLLISAPLDRVPEGFPLALARQGVRAVHPVRQLPHELGYLEEGDLLRFNQVGEVAVLYRKNSPHNSMLITERCNSKCLMCSQPPRNIDDGYLIDEWLTAIPMMSPDTVELGITGGEPTLCFDGLLRIIDAAKRHLP